MLQWLKEEQDVRFTSRKWKGFNRILAADFTVVLLHSLLDIDPGVVGEFLLATGVLYAAYAGANAFTKTKGVEA